MPELFILLAVGYFLIILLTLFKRGTQGRVARSLIFYALFSSIGLVIQYLTYKSAFGSLNDLLITWSPYFIILFLSIWFVSLSRNFLSLQTNSNSWVIFGLCWFLVTLITFNILSSRPKVLVSGNTWEFHQKTLFLILIGLGYVLMMGGAAIITLSAYRSAKAPLHKNRNVYWLLALTSTVCGDLLVFWGLGISGATLRLMGTFFVAYVLLIYDLADALQAGIRVLFYLIISAISLSVYVLVFYFARLVLDKQVENPLILWIALALFLVVLINPILQLVTRGLRRIVMGASYNTSNAVRDYSLRISNLVDLEALTSAALDTLHKTLDIHQGYLFLVDELNEEGKVFYCLRQVKTKTPTEFERVAARVADRTVLEQEGDASNFHSDTSSAEQAFPSPKCLDGRFSSESPIALYFTQTHQPLRQYDLDYALAFKQVPPEERKWMNTLDADVSVPVYDQRGWTGLLVLGPKASGNPYSKEDVNLLITLADQTSLALANARHFADLLALNEDQRRTFAALEKANQQLTEVDELKSAFIGVITHEMRTPFANLQFNLQILEMYGKDNLHPEQLDQLSQLSKGIQVARRMVDNLITLASFFSRQIVLEPEPLEIKEIMRNTFPPLKEFADEKNISFQVDIVGKLLPVQADQKLLSIAFYQLVHNAIKFTRDGGKVWVSCWTTANEFFFDVKDTGVGVPPDKLKDIWKTFTQTADPLRRGMEGLGLGLALVSHIVTADGGEVWVESQIGSGSVFGFQIPLSRYGKLPIAEEQTAIV